MFKLYLASLFDFINLYNNKNFKQLFNRLVQITKITTMEFSRLPTNVTPMNYDLTLTPSFETFTFEGQQSVDIIVSFIFSS